MAIGGLQAFNELLPSDKKLLETRRYLIDRLGYTQRDAAKRMGMSPDALRRRVDKIRENYSGPARKCLCGCGKDLPREATRRRRYFSDSCRVRSSRCAEREFG